MITALFQFSDAKRLIVTFAAVTGAVGMFVVYQAYRGYRRNGRRPMLYLAVGIILLTVPPLGSTTRS